MTWPFKKSIVRVELEAITRDDKVDMEAERTRITTNPIRAGERLEIRSEERRVGKEC